MSSCYQGGAPSARHTSHLALVEVEGRHVQLASVRLGPVDGQDVAEVTGDGPPHPETKQTRGEWGCGTGQVMWMTGAGHGR